MAAEWLFFEVCMGISDVCRTVCTALPEAVVGIQIYAVRYWPERCERWLERLVTGRIAGRMELLPSHVGKGVRVKLVSVGGSCCRMKKSLPENLIVLKSAYYVEKSYICL